MTVITMRKQFDDSLVPDDQRAAALFPALAYDPENHLFFLQDNSIGFGFECEPAPGGDERLQDRVTNFLNTQYPEHTMIQFILYRSPDITAQSNNTLALRDTYQHPILTPAIEERVGFFERYAREPMVIKSKLGTFDLGIVQNLKLLITFKLPISAAVPTPKELEEIETLADRAKSALNLLSLQPVELTAKRYLRTMGSLLNWGESASWRMGVDEWDQERLLAEQVLDYDAAIEVHRTHLQIGDHYARTLTAKKLPSAAYFGNALSYLGDLGGQSAGVKENYAVVATVYYPPAKATKSALEKKRAFTINQAQGSMLKFVPILAEKKKSFDILYEDLGEGAAPLKMSFSVVLFAPTLERLDKASTDMGSFFSTLNFSLMEDRYVHLPMLLNSLPFCCDRHSIQDLHRYKTMTGKQAGVLVPIFGEWKGEGRHDLTLLSRNGQIMSMTLDEGGSNMNCVIAAESGSGKSFLANEIITSYMSKGAQVWIIDAGKSYKNLCEVLEGDFLEFSNDSDIQMNPFELVKDYKEDEDILVSMVSAMASQEGNLNEFQVASLKELMGNLWEEKGNAMTMDDIAKHCLSSDDTRIRDMGTQLYPFTQNGAYGRYFRANNIDFKNKLTVLELDELQGRRHLRQVILLQLVNQIQQEVFLGDRNVPKVLLIDEAWDLLKDGEVSTFMEHAYRKFRKSNARAIICTQSINDLYDNTAGRAIAENSATMLLLGQKPESIKSVKRSGYLSMQDAAFDLLQSVRTMQGVYSEIFIKKSKSLGVGRLVVGEFQKLLYSTDHLDVNAINAYRNRGMNATEAIHAVMRDRGLD